MILPLLMTATFFVLSGIHFNWVFGGTFGFSKSIPIKENGEKLFEPKKFDSAFMGLVLAIFALFYVFVSGLVEVKIWEKAIEIIGWIIPGIFLLRAMGDFKYMGFFKKIKGTEFSEADTKVISPLCMVIGVLGLLVQLFIYE
jgi:hypothetical protein